LTGDTIRGVAICFQKTVPDNHMHMSRSTATRKRRSFSSFRIQSGRDSAHDNVVDNRHSSKPGLFTTILMLVAFVACIGGTMYYIGTIAGKPSRDMRAAK
jgi:hypothetical protein